MMKSLLQLWYQPNVLVWLLLPLSWLYCFISVMRRKLYQLNIKKSYSSQVPVVVVGNIVAGGSGKTPLLIGLCEYLRNKGFKPGVVSRGYGGSVSGVKQVTETDSADVVGDEPLMIFRKTNVPVVVAADRVAAVNYLLEHNHCDVVLSDDGLQHYRMKRDFEIAVVDSARRFGNNFCLPAGPLRERVSRLNEVDMVVYNGRESITSGQCYYLLEIAGVNKLAGENSSQLSSQLSSFCGKPVHAVAGIGHPQRFFEQLRQNGLEVIEHAYADHHEYRQHDFSGWNNECIIMTEKDAVKCRHLSLADAWVVSVKAVFSDALEARLSTELLPLLKRFNAY
ncbi:MAG: tetraacyldisaccharide 4'-kinase [Gammaproteobacteria bacterium]|nr:tetraacyldisaccharide 4'-kinase [Gammaproteobacteria bacterium]